MAQSKEEKRAYNREYYWKHRERLIAAEKSRYASKKEEIRAQRKKRYDRDKDQILAKQKERYIRDRDKILAARRRQSVEVRRYQAHGITKGEYEQILCAQDGVCAICRRECDVRTSLSIDHDHTTGRVRALLCGRCNSGLGFFRDSAELLVRAARYLRSHA